MLLLIEKSCAARKAPEALGASKPSSFDISEAIGQSMGVVDAGTTTIFGSDGHGLSLYRT